MDRIDEATLRAEARFHLNQSIMNYFYIIFTFIITHFNLIHAFHNYVTNFFINLRRYYVIIRYITVIMALSECI